MSPAARSRARGSVALEATAERRLAGLPRDRGTLLVLALVLVAQIWTLVRLEGYQLADSVEYMDRAWDIARGYGVGPESPRSFAFSAVLLPFFAIAELLEVHDLRPVVTLIRWLQLGVGLLCVALVVRIGARLHSLRLGWACGLLLGLSPVFLRYTVAPLSGPVAMLFSLLAFEAVFAPPPAEERDGVAPGLRAGLWFGLGLLAAYQTVLVAAPLLLVGLLRDRLRRPRFWGGLLGAFAALALLQGLLDLAMYGAFGSTLLPYLGSNVGGIVSRLLWDLGLEDQGAWVYLRFVEHEEIRADFRDKTGTPGELRPANWYLLQAGSQLLAWPALVLVLLGLLAAFVRPSWTRAAIALTLVANLALMSFKGAKDFRLWLPFLPLVALAAGEGLTLLVDAGPGRAIRRVARLAAGALLLAGVVLGLRLSQALELGRFGAFWRAMEAVAERAREHELPVKVASSYHWAALFRQEPGVELVKLSHDLDAWQALGDGERERVLAELSGIDFLITHLQAIEQDPRLMGVVGERYRVLDVFWSEDSAPELGPVYLLVAPRVELPLRGRRFFQRRASVDPDGIEEVLAHLQHPAGLVFGRGADEGPPLSLVFLGWELESGLADGALAWITYTWWAREVDGRDYRIHDRLTDNLAREAWNNRSRAHGALPTSTWTEGSLVNESYLIQVPLEVRQFGGPYARGELVPTELYLSATPLGPDGAPDGAPPLAVFDLSGRRLAPPSPGAPPGGEAPRPVGAGGRRWNPAAMILVGADWLPVPRARRFPTDGGPP